MSDFIREVDEEYRQDQFRRFLSRYWAALLLLAVLVLAAAGVAVVHRCHSGMIHHFYGLTGFIPAARVALAGIAADLGRALRS